MELAAIGEIVLQYGIFAGLFIVLFVWVMKENKRREISMQQTLDKVNGSIFSTVCLTEKGVSELDDKLEKVEIKVDVLDNKVDSIINKVDVLHDKMK